MMEDKPGSDDASALAIGSRNYRAYVGPPEKFDIISAMQFQVLTLLGMREGHYLLDIGCGSLRAGRLFIPYLKPGRYFGMEPNQWLIDEGIAAELGSEIVNLKAPTFSNDENFTLTTFGRQFDYLIAQSIFSHASAVQVRRCLDQASKVLSADGVFAATYFKGDKDYEGNDWVYPGIVYFTPNFMRESAATLGLASVELPVPHPSNQTWVAFYQSGAQMPRLGFVSGIIDEAAVLRERLAALSGGV